MSREVTAGYALLDIGAPFAICVFEMCDAHKILC